MLSHQFLVTCWCSLWLPSDTPFILTWCCLPMSISGPYVVHHFVQTIVIFHSMQTMCNTMTSQDFVSVPNGKPLFVIVNTCKKFYGARIHFLQYLTMTIPVFKDDANTNLRNYCPTPLQWWIMLFETVPKCSVLCESSYIHLLYMNIFINLCTVFI